jgi:hypothetical protein
MKVINNQSQLDFISMRIRSAKMNLDSLMEQQEVEKLRQKAFQESQQEATEEARSVETDAMLRAFNKSDELCQGCKLCDEIDCVLNKRTEMHIELPKEISMEEAKAIMGKLVDSLPNTPGFIELTSEQTNAALTLISKHRPTEVKISIKPTDKVDNKSAIVKIATEHLALMEESLAGVKVLYTGVTNKVVNISAIVNVAGNHLEAMYKALYDAEKLYGMIIAERDEEGIQLKKEKANKKFGLVARIEDLQKERQKWLDDCHAKAIHNFDNSSVSGNILKQLCDDLKTLNQA